MPNRVVLGKVLRSGNKYGLFISRSGVNVIDGSGNLTTDNNLIFNTLKVDGSGQLLHWFRTGQVASDATYTAYFSNFNKACVAVGKMIDFDYQYLGYDAYTHWRSTTASSMSVVKESSTRSYVTFTNNQNGPIELAIAIFAMQG